MGNKGLLFSAPAGRWGRVRLLFGAIEDDCTAVGRNVEVVYGELTAETVSWRTWLVRRSTAQNSSCEMSHFNTIVFS